MASTPFDEFSASLQQEALREMADSFFGARREIEDDVERMRSGLRELQALAERALERLTLLRALLLDEATVRHCLALLDLPTAQDQLSLALAGRTPRLTFPLPGGLRWSARYLRLLELAYAFAQDSCHVYMHGRYRPDPVTGVRSQSLSYRAMLTWCGETNERIRRCNSSQPPSSVLAYAGQLQGTGSTEGTGCTLGNLGQHADATLSLAPVDCVGFGLPDLPELPPPTSAGGVLRHFAREFYEARGPELRELMIRLEAERSRDLQALQNLAGLP